MNRAAILFIFGLSALSLLSVGAGRAAAPPAAPRLTLGPCTDPSLPKDARCGTYEVFENRAARKGRKIPLRVVVLPALGPDRQPDAITVFAGGPGQASVRWGIVLSQDLASLRQHRDFLLVDMRGTGGSAPLDCSEMRDHQDFLDFFTPAAGARACAERLRKTADLSQYTTDKSDLDSLKAAGANDTYVAVYSDATSGCGNFGSDTPTGKVADVYAIRFKDSSSAAANYKTNLKDFHLSDTDLSNLKSAGGSVAQGSATGLGDNSVMVSISIGLLNLFPIPLLDGGHLLFYAIEAVRGRPLSDRAQEVGFRIGLAIVLLLMIFATFNDILHLASL